MILAILGVCVLAFIACAIAADKSVDFCELFCILGGIMRNSSCYLYCCYACSRHLC